MKRKRPRKTIKSSNNNYVQCYTWNLQGSHISNNSITDKFPCIDNQLNEAGLKLSDILMMAEMKTMKEQASKKKHLITLIKNLSDNV